MDIKDKALNAHYDWKGKIETSVRSKVASMEDLSLAYTPGVAQACLAIKENVDLSYELTRRWNTVAVVTDSTAVLGLGDIGPEAGMPVMEGKCVLFKEFGDVDAVPICIRSKDPDDIVNTVRLIAGSFGGINLEDIASPKCVDIENRLKAELDIPVFHDDQHGTAIVVLSAMINAMKVVKKDKGAVRVVISGAGAAGGAVARLLHSYGYNDIIMCSSKGIIGKDNHFDNSEYKKLAEFTNKANITGSLADALKGADIFIGVSAPDIVTEEMVRSMNKDAIVLAMANPVPEIMPDLAKKGGAAVVGTGRSDFSNQINNVLAFPGVFRGTFDVRASDINEDMKLAAAMALAGLVSDEELNAEYIIPGPFDKRVAAAIAKAVRETAVKTGVARKEYQG